MSGGRSHDAGGSPHDLSEGKVPGEISSPDSKASASLRGSSVALKEVNTKTGKPSSNPTQSRNFPQQKLIIGLDLGDRSSCCCVLEEAGRIGLEQQVSNEKALLKLNCERTWNTPRRHSGRRSWESAFMDEAKRFGPALYHYLRVLGEVRSMIF